MANTSAFTLRSALEKESAKLTGPNFLDWFRNLRIILKQEKKEYVLEKPIPEKPTADKDGVVSAEEQKKYEKHVNDDLDVTCLMLTIMNSELQKQLEKLSAYDIIVQLRELFQVQARTERYETSKALYQCKLAEESPVNPHVLKMMGYIENLSRLGYPLSKELASDIILQSLPSSYHQFILNFNMNGLEKSMTELHGMLKTAEQNLRKPIDALLVNKEKNFKKKGKGKAKGNGKGKGKGKIQVGNSNKGKSVANASESQCFYCNEIGHWKRDCKKFKEDQKKGSGTSTSGIFVIEINISTYQTDSWVLDTGSGAHICSNMQVLTKSRMLKKGEVELRVGNGARVAALAIGTVSLALPSGMILELNKCYYVPAISRNIISISCLDMFGFEFKFKNSGCCFYLNDMYYGKALLHNGLYILDLDVPVYNIQTKRLKSNDLNPTLLWHCRLGHINEKRILKLLRDGLLDSFDFQSLDTCESCLLGKMTKAPFTGINERANDLLVLIHSDVCGPMSTIARGGFQYFITFTDDFSRFGYVYLMRHKSEAFERFKEFQNEVQNQLGKTIKAIRSDRGGEYLSQEFGDHLKKCGIVSQLTPPGTPQWNGVSERRNRTLLDMVRSMMSQSDLPLSFCGYALETAAFTLNRVPTKAVEKTPYEVWTGKRPSMSFLKIWGCEAYVKRLMSDKLTSKSDKCIFVGYPKQTKGFYFYNRAENKIFVARNGVFLEKEFISKGVSGSNVHLEEVQVALENTPITQHDPQEIVEPTQETLELRRSDRVRRIPQRYLFLMTEQRDILLLDNDEPTTFREAMMSPDSDKWLEAMKSEMQSMDDNQVWNLVDLPNGVKTIECKWIFKKKIDMDGNVYIHKARLVAKGFKQIHGIDYDETFSPVAMLKSIRIILAIAAYFDYEIWQMDVKTAFLNGNLNEDVYMTQPEGFINPNNARKVCKLRKSIYGLKQASRSWNIRFDEVVKGFGFIKNEEEPCVYKKTSGSALVFLVLYVDDILLIGNDIPLLESVKTSLKNSFSMKDLGEATYILGIRIYRNRSKRLIGLSQSTYIDKVLKRFNMQDSKKGFLPMSHGISLCKNQCPSTQDERDRMSKIPYASAIGSIMYAMICTRPDVSYALSATSRYQSDPGESHWIAVKNILKYLRKTKDAFLVYGSEEELVVTGYSDASFQTDKDDYRSQSGYVFCLNGGAVSWKSSKQETVADSTTEAEYIAASEAAKEAVWIRKFISELGVIKSIENPVDLYCDNNGAIAQAKEPRSHQKSKHILRRYHLIREIVNRGDVKICKIGTDANVADPLTKPLSQVKHDMHTRAIGIRYVNEWL